MYGVFQQEAWRHRPEEIRQEVAAIRLENPLRADRGRGSGLAQDLKWELARFEGLLGKHLSRSH